MNTLKRLIRVHRHAVDSCRRSLRDLEVREQEISLKITELQDQIAAEQVLAAGSSDVLGAYGAYARAAIERRRSLETEQDAARGAVAEAREALRDAYAELKRFEISLSDKILVQRRERARREQAELDEQASRPWPQRPRTGF